MVDLKMDHPGVAWLAKKIHEGKIMNPLDEIDVAIIRSMANHGMSITKTATAAYLSRATVYKRINRIKKKTGMDAMDFYGLCKLFVLVQKLERGVTNGKA